MLYSRVNLSTFVGGQPSDLPANLLGLADESLADLPAAIKPVPAEFAGIGYWPVVEADVTAAKLDKAGRRYLIPRPPAPLPDPSANHIPVSLYRQRLEKLGMLDDFAAYLVQSPTLQLKVLTLENGLIDPAYPDILAAFDVLKVPQAYQDYLNARPILGVPDVPNL